MDDVAAQPIAFIDLKEQHRRIAESVNHRLANVFEHGAFILGPEVAELERALAAFCGAHHAISCANGTEALLLGLKAKDIGPGDAVIVPSFTFAATAEVVCLAGASPVFADVLPDTFNLDPNGLDAAVDSARRAGLTPKAVIPVDLFGQPADYDRLLPAAERHGLWTMADAAQSFGATYRERRVGTIGLIATTSFFPAKPLGCYGDGGAVFTADDAIAEVVLSMRVHGKGRDRYDNVRVGLNSRLDTLQAAILLEKLAIFEDEIARRDAIANRYSEALAEIAVVPRVLSGCRSVWAQYTLQLPGRNRDAVAQTLKRLGIPTAVYYPVPLHRQTAYACYPQIEGGLPVSDRLAREVISLPMHPYLTPDAQDRIVLALHVALETPK
jgi:UDP-2-acetamido-2-deoxy-ribo-hexuluronate aminotransferase